jgi:hypothetical protein
MRYIEIDGKMYHGAIYLNYEGSREKRLARHNQLFLNFKTINVPITEHGFFTV